MKKMILPKPFFRILYFSAMVLGSFSLSSCDPALMIRVDNETVGPASMHLTFSQADRNFRWSDADTSSQLLIALDTASMASQDFYLGMGYWNTSMLDILSASISQIDLQGSGLQKTIRGKEEIREFFESSLSKKHKGQIRIVLK